MSLSFNLSSSSGRWLFGLTSGTRLGVDLESADRDIAGVRDLAFSPADQLRISSYTDARATDRRSAIAAWVAKEAAAKADGRGLRQDLRALRWQPATAVTPLRIVDAASARWTGIDGRLFGSHRFAALWSGVTEAASAGAPTWRQMPLGGPGDGVLTWHAVIPRRVARS